MSAINLSLADLKEAVAALSENESADFDAWYVGSKKTTRSTPAPAAATAKRPVTLEGPAKKQGETQPDGVLPPASKKARLDGGEAEEQGETLADAVLPPTSKKGKFLGDDGDDGQEDVDKEVATALTFEKTPAKKAAEPGADEDSVEEEQGVPPGTANAKADGAGGRATGAVTEGGQETTEVVAVAGNGLNMLASLAPLPLDPLQPLINAVASGLMPQGNLYSLPADAPTRIVVQCPNPECQTHFMPAHPDDQDGTETSIPGFEYITPEIMDSPAFAAMNLGFYISRQAGGYGTWEVIFGVSEGANAKGSRDPKTYGLSARVIDNQRKYGHLGKWLFVADGKLDGEKRRWGSTKKDWVFKMYAFEAMVKHAYRMRAKKAVDNEVTSTEMCQFQSMTKADECVLEIVGWMKDLIKDGTLTISANVQDATEGNITIDLDEPKAPYYSFDNLVGQSAHDHLNRSEMSRQTRVDFNDRDFWSKMEFIDKHDAGKAMACVKDWLKKEIRPEAKWNALDDDEQNALLERDIRPTHWKSDRSDFLSERQIKRWDEKFRRLGVFQKRGFGYGSRPGASNNCIPSCFIADDKELVELATDIASDLRHWRSNNPFVGPFVAKMAERYRVEFGLKEFTADRSTTEEDSAITLAEWMEVTGINKLSHARKLEWAKQLNVPWKDMGPCVCNKDDGLHNAMTRSCRPMLCVKCCMWHWVSVSCSEDSAKQSTKMKWLCRKCSGKPPVENAHAEAEERAAARKAAKEEAKKEKAAAEEAAAEEAAANETAKEEVEEKKKPRIIRGVKKEARVDDETALGALEKHDWDAKKAVASLLNDI